MVAPNGARKTKQDHPALPITIDDVVSTSIACHTAGADGLHLHVRDANAAHILDAGLYKEAMQALAQAVPDMQVQITTEAVGQYSASQQRNLVRACMPKSVSISPAELFADGESEENLRFYRWCRENEIAVQHILYGPADFQFVRTLLDDDSTASARTQLLFVLGRYAVNQESAPSEMQPFIAELLKIDRPFDWALCAFGKSETDCLVAAHKFGGKVRVGFENSFWNADGSIAKDNAERVTEVRRLLLDAQ